MLFEVGSSVGCDPTSLTALEDLQVMVTGTIMILVNSMQKLLAA
jgi:hypothetical protein